MVDGLLGVCTNATYAGQGESGFGKILSVE